MKEKVYKWIAWKLPKGIVYFATIRMVAFATQGKYSKTNVPELTAMEAAKRWENQAGGI